MKNRFPNMMHLVVGTTGKWELDNKWTVAAFEDGLDAIAWCEGCSRYGDWISQREEEWLNDPCMDGLADNDYRLDQWTWATGGTCDQNKTWEQEFNGKHPDGNFAYHRERELSLMINPYDDQAFANRSQYIKYEVVRVVLNPKEPYYAA